MNSYWDGSNVVQLNYKVLNWNLFPRKLGRISFFWKGVLSCLHTFRGCITQNINSGAKTLFSKDRWLNRRAPMLLWPDEFRANQFQNGTIADLAFL